MSDLFPRWPPQWLDDETVASEETLAATDDVQLISALRSDGRIMLSVLWPGGRRYVLVDPVGQEGPHALRVGQNADDAEVGRAVETVWSQALRVAKALIDGEIRLPAEAMGGARRRRRRRGQG